MMDVYDQAYYYELSIGRIGAKAQTDYFEAVAKRYGIPNSKSYLDIACGTSPQLVELAKRGYNCTGLDISKRMLSYLQNKAKIAGLRIETVFADMYDFSLKKKYDFAFVLSDSIDAVSNKQFLHHLECVARALNRGGIYLIDDFSFGPYGRWRTNKVEKNGIRIDYGEGDKLKDSLGQVYTNKIVMKVNDRGRIKQYRKIYDLKVFYPQEFKSLIELDKKFSFIGWFEHSSFKPLKRIRYGNTHAHRDTILLKRL